MFGFFTIIPFHGSDTEPRLFHETLERIELVDQLGFDAVWTGEHHFSRHGLVSGGNTRKRSRSRNGPAAQRGLRPVGRLFRLFNFAGIRLRLIRPAGEPRSYGSLTLYNGG